jgi:hypothetical protein
MFPAHNQLSAYGNEYENENEWGGQAKRPLHRDHFLTYFASSSALFRQYSRTSDEVHILYNRIS